MCIRAKTELVSSMVSSVEAMSRAALGHFESSAQQHVYFDVKYLNWQPTLDGAIGSYLYIHRYFCLKTALLMFVSY